MKNHRKEKEYSGDDTWLRERWGTVVVLLSILAVCIWLGSCTDKSGKSQKTWTVPELQGLKGKTRDEVRELLGNPSGMLTTDTKGRWEYTNVTISSEGEGPAKKASVVVYFSEHGEKRVTIVDIK